MHGSANYNTRNKNCYAQRYGNIRATCRVFWNAVVKYPGEQCGQGKNGAVLFVRRRRAAAAAAVIERLFLLIDRPRGGLQGVMLNCYYGGGGGV